jgi:saccharopine dehydrogenase-like NADP-dependent oxidoreductase
LNGQFAVVNAAPFHLTTIIAEAARAAGTHYLDLTEDVVSMRRVRELAANASTAFIPQCGLAPGFVSIVAFDMTKRFEVLDSVKLRVGALPQYPSGSGVGWGNGYNSGYGSWAYDRLYAPAGGADAGQTHRSGNFRVHRPYSIRRHHRR